MKVFSLKGFLLYGNYCTCGGESGCALLMEGIGMMAKGDFPDEGIKVDCSWEKGVNCMRGRRGPGLTGATGTTLNGIWEGGLRSIAPVLGWLGRRMLLVCCVKVGTLIVFMVLMEGGEEDVTNAPSGCKEGPPGLLCLREKVGGC